MHHKFCIVDGPRAIKRKNILKAYAEKLNVHAQYTPSSVKSQLKSKPARGFVMSGSLNWSTQAMVSNHESVIVTSHPNIVGKFEKEFESLWVETESVSRFMLHNNSISKSNGVHFNSINFILLRRYVFILSIYFFQVILSTSL